MTAPEPPRLPIRELISHVQSAEFPEDEPIDPKVTALTPQQRSFVALRVRGFSAAAASRKLKLNYMACHRWSNSEWFDAACEEERLKWLVETGIDDRVGVMAPLVNDAINVLKTSMQSEDEKVRLMAANRVFELFFEDMPARGPGRPRKASSEIEQQSTIDLSEIQRRAQLRILEIKSKTSGVIDIRANA